MHVVLALVDRPVRDEADIAAAVKSTAATARLFDQGIAAERLLSSTPRLRTAAA